MENLYKTDFQFRVNGLPHAFTVYHNIGDGISIDELFDNWIRYTDTTHTYTAKAFCYYVRKAEPSVTIMTTRTWQQLIKKEKL